MWNWSQRLFVVLAGCAIFGIAHALYNQVHGLFAHVGVGTLAGAAFGLILVYAQQFSRERRGRH